MEKDGYKWNLYPQFMRGIKKRNFVKWGKDHLNRSHQGQGFSKKITEPKQMIFSVDRKAVSNYYLKREWVVRATIKTTQPITFFRSPENRRLLKTLLQLGKFTDHLTIIADYEQRAQMKIKKVAQIITFGLQLDYWTKVGQ